ncbi:MAG: cytochrome c [Gemmataceae bacterium]|nr:cytochrome c [Gemmataceae bacterium]
MRPAGRLRLTALAPAVALVCWATPGHADQAQIDRGAYIFTAADCGSCHTNVKAKGPPLAGGRPLATPFGTFYSPNITADPETGIGRWTDADFIRALREGVSPEDDHYFPAFPYPSFTKMTDQDILDLKAYIFSLPPVAQADREHEIDFPFGWRFSVWFWKQLNFTEGAFAPDPAKSADWNRGAYLVEALAHCGECHTPRGWLGGSDTSAAYSGTPDGPEGEKVPNITPDTDTGIGTWSSADVLRVLRTGQLPDGDFVGSVMGEVVETSTSKLTDADRQAIAAYLATLPPVANPEAKAVKAE